MTEGESMATMLRLLNGLRVTQCISVTAKLGIADLLGDGPRTADDLASATGANPDALYRVLRALGSIGVFEESDGRRFALTPLSDLLRAHHPRSIQAQAIFFGSKELACAWANLPYTVATGKPAFDHIYGIGHFGYLSTHPEAAEEFNHAMSAVSGQVASAVAAAYEFASAQTVVDIGGGHGRLLSTILTAHPATRGVLFDQPQVVATAEPVLRAAGVADRCETVGGDFFAGPLPAGDILMMQHILHDWDDERCVAILRNCAHALKSQGKLLVLETVIAPGASDASNNFRDVMMLTLTGGRERTRAEYERLLNAAGLRLVRIIPTQSEASIIEAEQP